MCRDVEMCCRVCAQAVQDVVVGGRNGCRCGAHGAEPVGADIRIDVRGDLVGDDVGCLGAVGGAAHHRLGRGQPGRPDLGPPVVDGHRGVHLVSHEPPQGVPQRRAAVGSTAQHGRHRRRGRAMPVHETICRRGRFAGPGRREGSSRVTLEPKRLLRRTCRRSQSGTVGVQHRQIHPVLGAVPLEDLRTIRGEVRVLVAEGVARRDIGLGVGHRGACLIEARRDVERHPNTAAARASASAYRSAPARSAAPISSAARDHWTSSPLSERSAVPTASPRAVCARPAVDPPKLSPAR